MTRPYAAAAPKDVMAVTGRTIGKWTEAKNEKRYDAQPRALAEEAAVRLLYCSYPAFVPIDNCVTDVTSP